MTGRQDKLFDEAYIISAAQSKEDIVRAVLPVCCSFANADGGRIIVENLPSLSISEIQDSIRQSFSDKNRISACTVNDIYAFSERGEDFLLIDVAPAKWLDRPVYINSNPSLGTYRYFEGEFFVSGKRLLSLMARDSVNPQMDGERFPDFEFDGEAIRKYRSILRERRPFPKWDLLNENDFLERIGATVDGEATLAGSVVFGSPCSLFEFRSESCNIRSNGILDFTETALPALLSFSDGTAECEAALREAFFNCLIHADYSAGGAEISADDGSIVFRNSGIPRAKNKNLCICRNPRIMKMMRLVGFASDKGSGMPAVSAFRSEAYLYVNLDSWQTELVLRVADEPVIEDQPHEPEQLFYPVVQLAKRAAADISGQESEPSQPNEIYEEHSEEEQSVPSADEIFIAPESEQIASPSFETEQRTENAEDEKTEPASGEPFTAAEEITEEQSVPPADEIFVAPEPEQIASPSFETEQRTEKAEDEKTEPASGELFTAAEEITEEQSVPPADEIFVAPEPEQIASPSFETEQRTEKAEDEKTEPASGEPFAAAEEITEEQSVPPADEIFVAPEPEKDEGVEDEPEIPEPFDKAEIDAPHVFISIPDDDEEAPEENNTEDEDVSGAIELKEPVDEESEDAEREDLIGPSAPEEAENDLRGEVERDQKIEEEDTDEISAEAYLSEPPLDEAIFEPETEPAEDFETAALGQPADAELLDAIADYRIRPVSGYELPRKGAQEADEWEGPPDRPDFDEPGEPEKPEETEEKAAVELPEHHDFSKKPMRVFMGALVEEDEPEKSAEKPEPMPLPHEDEYFDPDTLPIIVQMVRNNPRTPAVVVREALLDFCRGAFRSLPDISRALLRSETSLKRRYIKPLLAEKALEVNERDEYHSVSE